MNAINDIGNILQSNIVRIAIIDQFGNVEIVELKNKLTNVIFNAMRDVFKGDVSDLEIKYLAWGSSSAAVSASHTTLQAEVGRKQITSQTAGGTGILTTTTYINPDEANSPKVEELGWFAGASATGVKDSGIMVGRILYSRQKTSLESWLTVRTDTFKEG